MSAILPVVSVLSKRDGVAPWHNYRTGTFVQREPLNACTRLQRIRRNHGLGSCRLRALRQ